jgi:hypothetical protein
MRNRIPIQLGIGTTTHSFSLAGTSFSGVANHTDSIAFRMDGDQTSQGARAAAVTFDLGATVSIGRHAYAGISTSFGHVMLRSPGQMTTGDGLSVSTANGTLYMSGGAVAGMAVPTTWGSVKTEMLVGRRLLLADVQTNHLDCESESFAHAGQWIAAPKIIVDRWLNPWMSTGVSVGTNLLNKREMSFGVLLRGHLRAFDGSRSRR